ncbi:hypothetical protein BDN71DRAFT_1440231 [Pleurotus eryngii]|uniref:Uncharacterized protein n=1 Tax=Pleurotus eryngii TaxID=5323 RepID=A0A9P6DJD2_PLEER|nr:hypothetical protein BDN71DRAFT_1440231 [Pleurotus eryngii]
MTAMSTPLRLSPPPVESAAPDSIGSFGSGWSTSPMRGPLPIQQPPSRPSFRVGTTQLGPLFPKYMYQRMDSDLHARSDIASDVADLAKFLNSRDVEMLDARGFGAVLGKIFGKLGPLPRREANDEAIAQLERLLQAREIGDELEARGLFNFIPKLISIFSKGRNAADTIVPPATPSPPAPTASSAPAPQRRSDDPDVQIVEQLLSRELDERRGFSNTLNTLGSVAPLIGTVAPYIPSIFDKIREKVSGHDQPPQATAAPFPQRRAMKDDMEELERLLRREMTDIECRGFSTKLGQAAPFAH